MEVNVHTITTALVIPALILGHLAWATGVQKTVPDPYLDEFFHIPQANTFWQGNWSQWDNKITTPPGIYLWSILYSKIYWADTTQHETLSTHQTRSTNNILPYALAICILILERSTSTISSRSSLTLRPLCVFEFPLIFFFSGLYYTDVFSAVTVMFTYAIWRISVPLGRGVQKFGYQILVLAAGLISLTARQTNIFWVAIFLGGLQAFHTVKLKGNVYDPPVTKSTFEDLCVLPLSSCILALKAVSELLFDLWPHVTLIASFIAFVKWNGGVVLGDKSNHVATIHLPQMLYIWPFILFFSWPVLLPYLARPKFLLNQLPRIGIIVLTFLAFTAFVHYNTIVHPFLLADNRHYTFYIFKILRNFPWMWYALVPVYAVSAWLSIIALGGIPQDKLSKNAASGKKTSQQRIVRGELAGEDENHLSFLIVWLISTSLSLITAPLVEPRYFIVPWLIWRLHVPDCNNPPVSSRSGVHTILRRLLNSFVQNSSWVEIVWYMSINFVTCRLFLERGFQWPQSPDEIQRFMW